MIMAYVEGSGYDICGSGNCTRGSGHGTPGREWL
jgi:hypothetical protein